MNILSSSLQNHHNVKTGASTSPNQHHFHWAWSQVPAPRIWCTVHVYEVTAAGFCRKCHAIIAQPFDRCFHNFFQKLT
jgi:hypothetical protein